MFHDILIHMRIEINAVRLELTGALKEYIESKLGSVERLIKKFEEYGELIAFVEISRTTRHHRQGGCILCGDYNEASTKNHSYRKDAQ